MTTSAVLVQEAEVEQKLEGPVNGVRILEVSSRIDKLAMVASKNGVGRSANPFDFEMGMTETGRTRDSLSLNFAFSFGKSSTGQSCSMAGSAVLRFANFSPDGDLSSLGSDIDNEMAIEIFRSNYEAIYLLHESLGMEAPTPWITQDVCLSSRSQQNS